MTVFGGGGDFRPAWNDFMASWQLLQLCDVAPPTVVTTPTYLTMALLSCLASITLPNMLLHIVLLLGRTVGR